MRVRRPQQDDPESRPNERIGTGARSARPILLGILAVALVVVVAVWFRLEGYRALSAVAANLQRQTGAGSEALPVLRLDIADREYQALAESREAALRGEDPSREAAGWVAARLEFWGETVTAEIRLAGDSAADWRENKWSLQARAHGSETLKGMQQFSLQSPANQGFLNGWLYALSLRRAGILTARFDFVRLSVNGADWGAYALLEDVSGAMLEAGGRRSGVIVGFACSAAQQGAGPFDEACGVDGDPVVLAGAVGDQTDAATRLLRAFQRQQLAPSAVFDAQVTGRYLAHANLWDTREGLRWGEQRYYYDPAAQWLEPIASPLGDSLLEPAGPTDLAQFDDPVIMEAYAREALRLSRPEYLEGLRMASGEEFERLSAALLAEFKAADLTPPWPVLAERQVILKSALYPMRPVHAFLEDGLPDLSDPEATLELWVANLVPHPVALSQLRGGDSAIEMRSDWVRPSDAGGLYEAAKPDVVLRSASGNRLDYVRLRVPSSLLQPALVSGTLQIVAHVAGVDSPTSIDVEEGALPGKAAGFLPSQPTLEEALERYPFLARASQAGYLELKPGTWQVEGDLILPDGVGVLARQGATLEFERPAILYSTGPLVMGGPGAGSIRLVPREGTWAGIYVAQADAAQASELYEAEIVGTAGIQRAGWSVDAGITFEGGAVTLERCRVEGSTAGTALHLEDTSFEIVETEFGAVSGDALSADAAPGIIRQATFQDIMGTALDFRGSEVVLEDVALSRCLDRGIQAGQESVVTADGIRAESVRMAVASTDGSQIEGHDVFIAQAWTAAFAAYRTGPDQGPASIDFDGVVFRDESSDMALVQEGSRITIDGVDRPAGGLNLGALYRRRPVLRPAKAVDYQFGPNIRLAGYALPDQMVVPGDAVQVVLTWQALAELDRDYTVFLHVRDGSGQAVAQRDSMPRDSSLPTSQWSAGEVVEDGHSVPLPRDLPPGEYELAVGLYYWETMERLPVQGPDGEILQEGMLILGEAIRVGE